MIAKNAFNNKSAAKPIYCICFFVFHKTKYLSTSYSLCMVKVSSTWKKILNVIKIMIHKIITFNDNFNKLEDPCGEIKVSFDIALLVLLTQKN